MIENKRISAPYFTFWFKLGQTSYLISKNFPGK